MFVDVASLFIAHRSSSQLTFCLALDFTKLAFGTILMA